MTQTPDYQKLIDEETWQFIRDTEACYPPDAINYSIEKQREVYDELCRQFFNGYPQGISAEDLTVPGSEYNIRCRRYRWLATETEALVLYFHGGGFVVGGLDSHDDVCAELCGRTGYQVISVDYRMSPEFDHPAAFEDCRAVLDWAVASYDVPVVLCGDSAGGNLAAAVAHDARDRVITAVAGQVLIYPGLGGDINQGSYLEHANAPMLTRADIEFYADIRTKDEQLKKSVSYAPLNDSNYAGLPATVIITADCDPLRDDGRDYRDAIKAAGGRVHWRNEPGLVHGYLRARHTVDRAKESFTAIVKAVAALGKSEWPY